MSAALLTEVIPGSGASIATDAPEARTWIAERYARADDAYVRLNMITSLTGSAVGTDGTSETLTSRVDRSILGAIRREADVVLVGAASVRAEGYIVPTSARLAVVTRTGDLHGHRLDTSPSPHGVILLCPADRADAVAAAAHDIGAEVLAVDSPDGDLAPAAIVRALTAAGLGRIVCEGGPSLASAFVAAGAIDELCITSAPAVEPSDAPFLRIGASTRPRTQVDGMLVDSAGFSYLRLRVLR